MKFDVIVGNPPYQLNDASNGVNSHKATPMYNKFVEAALDLDSRYVSMIIPSRWMAGGWGLDSFRRRMLSDKNILALVDFPDPLDIFSNVNVGGGICYFLRGPVPKGICETSFVKEGHKKTSFRALDEFDVFVRDSDSVSILKKVIDFGEQSFGDGVSPGKPFGLSTKFRGDLEGDIVVYQKGGTSRYFRSSISTGADLIDSWKVIITHVYGKGGDTLDNQVINKPIKSPPGSCCTETYVIARVVKDEIEADSVSSYMRTRFFRFLVSLRKITQAATSKVYKWVPVQTWDRIWTDEELYAKYGITEEEQAHIAKYIREMPSS